MAQNHIPIISVVMPTYNAAKYVCDAVASILAQDFTDFELLVVDDGSTDDTAVLLQSFGADPRVHLLRNERNMGLIATLHRAYAECRAPLIARMDSDDICDPARFGRQVEFLRQNPDVAIVGGAIRFFGNVTPNVFCFPSEHTAIRPAMLFYCPLAHPALMFRRELVDQGLLRYDDTFRHAEDYHLWSHLLRQTKAANLPEVVLDYRLHPQQVSSDSADKQYTASVRVRRQMLFEAGIDPSEEDVALHESVILERPLAIEDYLSKLAGWFRRLEVANEQSGYWDSAALHQLLRQKFLETARRTASDLAQLSVMNDTGHYLSTNDVSLTSGTRPGLVTRIKQRVKALLWRRAVARMR